MDYQTDSNDINLAERHVASDVFPGGTLGEYTHAVCFSKPLNFFYSVVQLGGTHAMPKHFRPPSSGSMMPSIYMQ